MAWYNKLWPWGREKRERRKKIEADFDAQLKEAYEQHGDLNDIVEQLRENRKEQRAHTPPQPVLQGSDT